MILPGQAIMRRLSGSPNTPSISEATSSPKSPTSPARMRWAKLRAVSFTVGKLQKAHMIQISAGEGSVAVTSLEDLQPAPLKPALLRRRASTCQFEGTDTKVKNSFWQAAGFSVLLGVLSVVPYGLILARDPRSPLFISFILHLVIVATQARHAKTLWKERKIPIKYHLAIVVLAYLFNTLKCDAFARLPTSVCMLLLNLRMLVGVVVQFVLFHKTYSFSQLACIAVITSGIAWASNGMQAPPKVDLTMLVAPPSELWFGTLEIVLALLSLTLLSVVVKLAFSKYGEHVEEQIFVQHLCSLPLFFQSSQWNRVGPIMWDWLARKDLWLAALLLANVLLTFGGRSATVAMSGRAPNLLMVQLVQTIEKFSQLLVTALVNVPPFPPIEFWAGSLVLALGTVGYLSASDAPKPQRE